MNFDKKNYWAIYLDPVCEVCVLEVSEPCKHVASWSEINASGQIYIILLPECSQFIIGHTLTDNIHTTNCDAIVTKLWIKLEMHILVY